jgi:nucleoside-diphosphate-sugar epimerase
LTSELGRPPEAAGLPKLGPSLITGAAGFIGRALALALRFEGLEVRGLVRPQHDAGDLEAAGVHVVRGDATDADALADAAAGCQVIFHLAAARGTHKLGHRAYQDLNRRMTEAVSRAALSVGVRRVVLSSSASLSGYPGPHRQTEDTPVRPNSGYRASRLLSEEILDQFQRTEGLNFVVARLSQAISGPGAYAWTKVVRSVREGRYRVLPKGGSIHSGDVEDIVDGLRRCAVAPGICGERFLLGAPEPMPTVTVLQTIARHLDVPFAPTILPAAPFLAYVALGNRVYRALRISLPHHFTAEFYSARVALDIDRARRRLGYSPRFDMSTSIERTVAWLRESSRV